MKRLIDFCLLLLMVFWGSNAWADKTMKFSATYPTSDCNLTKLNVSAGSSGSIENGGITLQITAASGANASWNDKPDSNHGQTIGLAKDANITNQTGGLDNYTVQAYPYTWNFTDESLWKNSESQFVSEIWTYNTADEANEW